MKTIFTFTGHNFEDKRSSSAQKSIKVYHILDNKGSLKWIANAQNEDPVFLKFHNIYNFKTWLYAKWVEVLFALHLQYFIAKEKVWYYSPSQPLFDVNSEWAIDVSKYKTAHKAMIFANKTFYKVAINDKAQELMDNEYLFLKKMQFHNEYLTVPLVAKINEQTLQLSDVSTFERNSLEINDAQINVLLELSSRNKHSISVQKWDWFNKLVPEFVAIKDSRIPVNLVRKMEDALHGLSKFTTVTLGLSHGDFTLWNQFQNDNKIALYDWELARLDYPLGYDYFHFVFQKAIATKMSWKNTYNELKNCSVNEKGESIFNHDFDFFKKQLNWYLLTNCMSTLKTYSELKKWNKKMYWQMNLWNEAFNMIQKEEKSIKELFLMDIFDSMQNYEYGAINEFKDPKTKNLTNLDLDCIIDKKKASKTVRFIKQHSLVQQFKIQKYPNCSVLELILVNKEIIKIQFVWTILHKNMEILNAFEIYKNNPLNTCGIKEARELDTARYTILNYILNDRDIPESLQHLTAIIENSDEVIDLLITYTLRNNENDYTPLINLLKKNPKNTTIKYFKNWMLFVATSYVNFCRNTILPYLSTNDEPVYQENYWKSLVLN